MGVYIPNMEKPRVCGLCPSYHLVNKPIPWDGPIEYDPNDYVVPYCVILEKDIDNIRAVRDDCPLIEIPTPHGRLIDENDVKAKCVNEVFDKMGTVAITETYFGDEWADDICDIPTIIEAED